MFPIKVIKDRAMELTQNEVEYLCDLLESIIGDGFLPERDKVVINKLLGKLYNEIEEDLAA